MEKGDIQIKAEVLPPPLHSLTKVELSGAHTLQLHSHTRIPYGIKLSRENNFAVLELPANVFSMKFVCALPTYDRF